MSDGTFTADRLLALYDRVAEAEDAIPRLRRFVLDLAVRGKLTERGILEGEIRTLGSVAEFVMGQAPPGEACNESGVGTLFVKVGEFGERYPEHKAWTTQPLKFAKAGDVLICVVGATVGKLNLGIDCAIGRSVAAIRPNQQKLATEYLFYSLMPFTLGLREGARGSAQGVISKPDLAKLHVWLPPLAEQQRIVAKVDELMALCDRLEGARAGREAVRDRLTTATLARLTAPETDAETFPTHARFALQTLPTLTTREGQIKTLRQTILNLAVRGKLVAHDPADEPAAELLKRIGVHAEDQNMFAEQQLPPNWAWASIEDCFVVSGGMQKTPARTPGANAFPYLGVGNVYRGRLDLSNVKKFELAAGELERFRLEPGDILVVEGNGSSSEIGRCAVWTGEIADCVHQNHIIRCRPKERPLTAFAALYLNSPSGTEEMKRLAITSAGLFSLSVGKIRRIAFPLPPLAEQHRIVAKVDALMALCDQLEASLTTATTTRSRLLEALLHEALQDKETA